MFPTEWTRVDFHFIIRVGFDSRLLGIEWSSYEDLTRMIVYFEQVGLIERTGGTNPTEEEVLVRRIPGRRKGNVQDIRKRR